ncbi:MAG: hypothetical protein ACE5JJ_08930 [Nitrospinota bacterium]
MRYELKVAYGDECTRCGREYGHGEYVFTVFAEDRQNGESLAAEAICRACLRLPPEEGPPRDRVLGYAPFISPCSLNGEQN